MLKTYSFLLGIPFLYIISDMKMPKECLRAAERANAIMYSRDDMLIVFDYGSALFLNGRYDEAMREFDFIFSKSLDYIAYNEHGEGMRYAKRLVSMTHEMIGRVKKAQAKKNK